MPNKLLNTTPAIFVDVDGTLIKWTKHGRGFSGVLNRALVERLQKVDGDLVLWSRRGRLYAEKIAKDYGVSGMFTAIVGKPTAIVDDEGASWAAGIKINP